ncbi:hypothetical protein DFR26_1199 [Paraperlucidibaca baekdonensis]|uniref:Dolichyl-phosphate-mannose-protein mannosyltransferase n=1 Tax=Paraperlucidibaca baekdonensis TaxID=748120 RepID=A0A3E0H855_9GAMM|nr:hypothetical protein [Paraperlucidibaca baekdonensis]REH39026.1 hypothetical protein DFR26_1199 [Paraperlucidibaca baekdonensis]
MQIDWSRNKALFAVFLIMLIVLGRNVVSQASDLSRANLPNPDSYYKLVILKDYKAETGFQYIARDNAPYGSWSHWSLPHTWVVWQLHHGLMFFGVDKNAALLWAGGGLTLLSMLLLAIFVALVVANVGSPIAAFVSAIVLVSSTPLFGYGQLVQITHHVFMLLPLAAAAVFFLRREFKASLAQDFLGGLFLGVGIWISPETMPLVLVFAAMRAAIRLQVPSSGTLSPAALGLMLALITGWVIDSPPPTFSLWALDHISFAWLLFGGLLAVLLLLTDWCVARHLSVPVSVCILVLALVLVAICWLILVPGALAGPEGLIPDELKMVWYSQIMELQPITLPSQWLGYLLVPIIGTALLGYIAWRESSLWMLVLAASTLIYAVLGASHIRMAAAMTLISTMTFSIGLSKLRAFVHMQDSSVPMREQLLVALFILSVPLQILGSIALAYFDEVAGSIESVADKSRCQLDIVLPLLKRLPPGTVLANPNLGPEILFKTQHQVIAGNYHHNINGLLDSFRLLRSVSPDIEARSLISTRHIDYILSCAKIYSTLTGEGHDKTLAQRIAAGEQIDWLPEKETVGDWRLYKNM